MLLWETIQHADARAQWYNANLKPTTGSKIEESEKPYSLIRAVRKHRQGLAMIRF